jgi:D-methionine transport system permease protein
VPDLGNLLDLAPEFATAFGQTALMLAIGLGSAVVIGGPLGVLLFLTSPRGSLANPVVFRGIGSVVNLVRSFPFIILLVALVPITRALIGTSIGPVAAAVPLSVAAIPYFARLVEQTLLDVPRGVIEAAHAMGASEWQIVTRVLVREARSGLVLAVTVLAVSFLSYSAIAGVVGGGGIGDLAIRYGYYRFQTDVMVATVVILVAIVQVIQWSGNAVARALDRR